MMRRIAALLLALCMLVPALALGEEEAAKPVVTIRVLDGAGEAIVGADVVIYNEKTEVYAHFTVDEENAYVLTNLPDGMYSVRATDPSDGYSDADSFYYDLEQGDQDIDMVIRKLQEGTYIRVGNFTRMSGDFFTDMWGNNTADIDMRALLHGMSTVDWTNDRQYALDASVLAAVSTEVTKAGKTYTFTLADGLTYNDGTPVTAADYVFSVLLQSSAVAQELGGKPYVYAQLAGQEDYLAGEADVFAGVRLLDERTFSLTISKDFMPYYYELMYVNVTPYPIGVIAPGCEVKDEGEGAYIEGPFTAELLSDTLFNAETGYVSHPATTSGPYQLVSYDEATGEAELLINLNYPGNYEGHRPVIERLHVQEIGYEDALEKLTGGEIDVLNKGTDGELIEAGMALMGEGTVATANYIRSGYGFVGFDCEDEVTGSLSVRQAIAMCIDRETFIQDFLSGFGMPVYSYYGLGQWMVQPYVSTIADEVTTYDYDPAAAEKLLEKDGWSLNAEGGKYAAADGVRFKKLDGALVPLKLRFAQLKDNRGAQLIVDGLLEELKAIGFEVEVTEMGFEDMLSQYYRQTERNFNANFMATNFAMVFDPYYTFHTGDEYQGSLNTSGIRDEELMKLAKNLRETTPGDEEEYGARWLKLMRRFSDVLPTLPVYSNIYFDFFTPSLKDYAPNALWSWAAAIQYAYVE